MSFFLEFYALSLLVCVPLTILLCKYFNNLPKSNSLHMDKGDAWRFTLSSLFPIANIVVAVVLFCVFIFTSIVPKLSKINFYKD